MKELDENQESTSIVPSKVRNKPKPAPKPPAKSAAAKQSAKPKKKAGFAAGFMTGLLIVILAVGGGAAAVWFNVSDLKTTLVTVLKLDEEQNKILENRKNELAKIEAEQIDQKNQMISDQQEVDKKSKEQAAVEVDLTTRASDLNQLDIALSEQKTKLDNVVAIYEAMEPATTAAILTAAANMSDNLVILKNMNQSKLALILAEMTPAKASEVLGLIAGDLSAGN